MLPVRATLRDRPATGAVRHSRAMPGGDQECPLGLEITLVRVSQIAEWPSTNALLSAPCCQLRVKVREKHHRYRNSTFDEYGNMSARDFAGNTDALACL